MRISFLDVDKIYALKKLMRRLRILPEQKITIDILSEKTDDITDLSRFWDDNSKIVDFT